MNIDFESFIGLLIAFAIGCRLGYVFYEFKIEMLMSKLKEHSTEILTDTDKQKMEVYPILDLYTEQIDNSLLLYEADTHNFICQGKTIEELALLSKLHNNINCATVMHSNKMVLFVNGQITEQI